MYLRRALPVANTRHPYFLRLYLHWRIDKTHMSSASSSFSLSRTFSALRHRNYRLWFAGQIVMMVGTWMQSTAQGYLVYELTGSTAYLGVVSFAAGVPSWLFTLFGGVVADRVSRRNLLIITQSINMLLALDPGGADLSAGRAALDDRGPGFCLGTTGAFEGPARQSFLTELVDREDIPNAIAFNSTMFNLGTVIGPAAGGLVYAAVGPGWCFMINGLYLYRQPDLSGFHSRQGPSRQRRKNSAQRQLAEGLRFTLHHPEIRYLILGMGMMGMVVFGSLSLLPAWARDVLQGDSTTFGLFNSARGLGSLIAALIVATISHLAIRGKIWIGGILADADLYVSVCCGALASAGHNHAGRHWTGGHFARQ